MTSKHLLWWVFKYLVEHHPTVMVDLLKNCDGSFQGSATLTVNAELNAAFDRFKASL